MAKPNRSALLLRVTKSAQESIQPQTTTTNALFNLSVYVNGKFNSVHSDNLNLMCYPSYDQHQLNNALISWIKTFII